MTLAELAEQVELLWRLVDPAGNQRNEFAAAAKKEQEQERIRAAERRSEESAQWLYQRAHRRDRAWTPDYESREYLELLAQQRLRDGLPSRADLREYETVPPMKHRIRTLDNDRLGFSNSDSAAYAAEGDRLQAIADEQEAVIAGLLAKVKGKSL